MESQLRSWLTLQCQMIVGTEAGLAVFGAHPHASGALAVPWPADAEPGPRLSAAVDAAMRTGQPWVQPPGDAGDPAGSVTHLALPLSRAGRVVGAVGLAVRGVPAPEIKSLVGLLGFGVRSLELWVEAESGREQLATRLALAGSLLDREWLAEAGHAFAAELARAAGCERVAIGMLREGRMRVVALSSGLRFSEESDGVRDVCAAMEEAVDQDVRIELPAVTDGPALAVPAHELLQRGSGAGAVFTLPLSARERPVGALTCEWRASGPPAEAARDRVADAAVLCGPILELMGRAEAGPLERVKAWLTKRVERYFGADRSLAKGALASAGALLLLLAVFPASYRVGAEATLEGRVQRALVAGVSGYLSETNVRAGDLVRAGDVLAKLDDRDLRLEHRKRGSEKLQLDKEYREALAGGDRTQVSILRSQIDHASAKLALVQERLGRTNVVAPFDGIVLVGDLDQSLGSPVELGDVLFEVAPLDGYRIIVEVDGRDIADVAVGQRGKLALSALPGETLPLVVERITPISTSEEGRHFFRVEAALEEPLDALRPGMDGVAKIDVGRRRLLWIVTHDLFDWLRLSIWSYLP